METVPNPQPCKRDIVLLIDDAPDTVRMIAEALDEAGFTVLVATDGEIALERLNHVTPDVILLDVCMPGLNGFETCRRIRNVHSAANVPIIFMTGMGETDRIVEGLSAGGVDYLVKPVMPDELVARIRAHLRVSREHGTALRALELTGLGLAFFSRAGVLLWHTPIALERLAPARITRIGGLVADYFSSAIALETLQNGLAMQNASVRDRSENSGMLLSVHDGRRSEPAGAPAIALTGREMDVLEWVAKGKTNRDIGDILGMSPRTVNKHLEHIYEKFGVENRTAAVARFESFARTDHGS